jgi:hypothetical protein
MKAEWLESTDKHVCLCCGQLVLRRTTERLSPERCERSWELFEAMGLTREDLLVKHREQVDYQAPGFIDWLKGQ